MLYIEISALEDPLFYFSFTSNLKIIKKQFCIPRHIVHSKFELKFDQLIKL